MNLDKTLINKYLLIYGNQLTNNVLKIVDSLDGSSSYEFIRDFNFFYYLFPKINFYNKKTIKDFFMDEFDNNSKEYKRIEKMFEYISNSLCGIRKKF